jgi:hypothetical protein
MKWWFFLMLKVIMVKGKRLNKFGDLEVQKKNVASLEHTIRKQNVTSSELTLGEQNVAPLESTPKEQNVVPSKLRINESNNLCVLELIMVIICNSNDEISRNIDWKF